MLVFVVIPFMELLLPVALKLFPNMLPSTFEDKLKKEEEMKQRIGARLEVARFLQDTVAEMASNMRRQRSGDNQTSAAELYQFMKRVRAGEPVAPAELLKFAQLFNDELTLDNLERVQLVSLCRFVGISPFGTDSFLRARLRSHLQDIKEDDREIQAEGMASLSEDELRTACRARGMRAPFGEGSAAFMRGQLAEWLDWSLNRSLPSSLLLLSRAFTVTAPICKPAALDVSSIRETLSTLPDEAVEDVELFATSDGGDKTEAIERKLDLLEREEEMIREEEEYEAAVSAEAPPPSDRASGQEMAAAAAAVAVVRGAAAGSLAEMLDDSESAEERAARAAAAKEARMRNVLTCVPGCRLPSVFLCVCVCGGLLECSPEERHVRPAPALPPPCPPLTPPGSLLSLPVRAAPWRLWPPPAVSPRSGRPSCRWWKKRSSGSTSRWCAPRRPSPSERQLLLAMPSNARAPPAACMHGMVRACSRPQIPPRRPARRRPAAWAR